MDVTPVLVVEDEPRTRERLGRAISAAPDLGLAGAAGNLAEGREALETLRPAVLLTDLGLPDGSGVELIAQARRSMPGTHSMVVTVFGDEQHVLSAIEAGATGYLLKDGTREEIAEAVRELVAGGSPISAAIARHLLRRFQDGPALESGDDGERGPSLTAREREVLGLVAKGFRLPEIARLLEVSPHTVKTHVRHIYDKLEVNSRGEAVYQAVQRGIL
ncbi:MAG: response regulator [Myxococcota bacterium]